MYAVDMNTEVGVRLDALEWALKQKNWTPTRLSDETGISKASLSLVLSGKRSNITADTLVKMAAVLGVSTDFLLGLTKNPVAYDAIEGGRVLAEIINITKTLPSYRQRDLLALALTYQQEATMPTRDTVARLLEMVEELAGKDTREALAALLLARRGGKNGGQLAPGHEEIN
jgi:transcriptional regulator with XRE-family HTH domain